MQMQQQQQQQLYNPRPIGGSDQIGRALSPTFHNPVQQQITQNGGPAVHRKYRQGLKDPAEMEHLMIKRQREAEQAAVLEAQVLDHKARKKKEKEDQKARDEGKQVFQFSLFISVCF